MGVKLSNDISSLKILNFLAFAFVLFWPFNKVVNREL